MLSYVWILYIIHLHNQHNQQKTISANTSFLNGLFRTECIKQAYRADTAFRRAGTALGRPAAWYGTARQKPWVSDKHAG